MAKKKKTPPFAIGDKVASATLKNLPFVLFLGVLFLLYLGSINSAQRRILHIQELRKEVEALRREYNALESEISYNSKLSNVRGEAGKPPLNLRCRGERVYRITLNDQ